MDLSDIFRKGLQNLHKNIIDKNYKKKSLLSRKESFMNARRQTRDTLIFRKRNIDMNNMSPYITPEPENKKKFELKPKVEVPNKRLEKLQQWKEKRNKQKEEEKKRAKPIFKVCHVNESIGLPNLDKVNKEIKGRPIKHLTSSIPSFAPANHVFKAPNNLKPVERSIGQKSTTNVTSKIKSVSNVGGTKIHPKIETKFNGNLSKNKLLESRIIQKKPSAKIVKPINNASKINIPNTEVTANKKQPSKPIHASKTVGWDLRQSFDISDDSSDQKEQSGKRYKKTPKKAKTESKNTTSDDINHVIQKFNGTRTPVRKYVTPKKAMYTHTKTTDQTPNKVTTKESFKTPVGKVKTPRMNRSIKATPSSLSKSKVSVSKQHNKATKNNSVILIEDDDSGTIEFDDLENELEKVVIYDDEEITLKTPVKTSRMSRVSSVRKSIKPVGNNNSMFFNDTNSFGVNDEVKKSKIISKSNRQSNTNNSKSLRRSEKQDSLDTPSMPNNKSTILQETTSNEKTPDNSKIRESTYISPFVTISRGKDAARREFEIRKSTGGTFISPEGKDFSSTTSPQAGADYFERLLSNQISRIKSKCAGWEMYQEGNNLTEETNDMINVVIGQSNLLITKKFEQFRGLISECKTEDFKCKPVTCEDLHGFWDMMYKQVIDLDNRFENLEKLRNNNWEEILPEKKALPKRARGRPKKTTASSSSSIRDMIKSARNKMRKDEVIVALKTPEPVRKLTPKSNTKDSLRVSVLKGSAVKRLSSPGLTMMKVTQAIKAGDGITPSKSILKTSMSNSTTTKRRHTKSVLFVDSTEEEKVSRNLSFSLEDKENNLEENIIINIHADKRNGTFTPRRSSRRLNKVTSIW